MNSGTVSNSGTNILTVSVADSAVAEIKGGTVSNSSSSTIVAKTGGQISITGGIVTTSSDTYCAACATGENSKITLNGGIISASGNSGLVATTGGAVEVLSGTINASYSYAVLAHEGNASATVSGGVMVGDVGAGSSNNGAGNTLTISGGIINGIVSVAEDKGTAAISGGVFKSTPLVYGVTIAQGHSVLALNDNTFKYGVAATPTLSVNAKVGTASTNTVTYDGTKVVTLTAVPSITKIDAQGNTTSTDDDFPIAYNYS